MKKAAVVILNWNGKDLLKKFLPSVLAHTDNKLADIIIADNASTDDSVSFVDKNYPTVRVIRLSENYGFAEGYNKALSQIDNEYYILLNSDVEVTSNWLEPLTEFLKKNKQVAAVQPKLLSEKNKSFFEYAGAAGGFIDKYGYPFCRGRIFSTIEKDVLQYDQPMSIFWATGACMCIRAKEYREVGGFDSSFFAHMEEIDLCWRLNARGRLLYCVPQSKVYHVGGATLEEESPHKTFLNFRNNTLMLYKNLPAKEFKKIYRVRLILDYVAALQMLLKNKKSNAKAVIAAHKEFIKLKNGYDISKAENLKKQTEMSVNTIYPKSILYRYYIKKQKLFSELDW